MKRFLKIPGSIILFTLLIGFFVFIQWPEWNEIPDGIHAWAKAGRIAIVDGFLNNGFNFFLAESYTFNKQTPHWWEYPYSTTITSVNFPIHEYLIALLKQLFQTDQSWVFQGYIFLWSILGLAFLYKLSEAITQSFYKSAFVLILASTSPLFLAYQSSFLITIPCLSLAIIGVYYYFQYQSLPTSNYLIVAICFLSLASLSRITFAIPLIAVVSTEFIYRIKSLKSLTKIIFYSLLSGGLIIGYEYYNYNLSLKHGSIFLAELRPAESLKDLYLTSKLIWKNWSATYFTVYHYAYFLLLIIAAIGYGFSKRNPFSWKKGYSFWLIYSFGVLCFFVLMLQQFINHDYYVLDTFFLPLILLTTLLLEVVPLIPFVKTRLIKTLLLLCLVVPLLWQAHLKIAERNRLSENSFTVQSKLAYTGSAAWLDELRIAKTARIMAFNPPGPNYAHIFLKRKGYVIMSSDPKTIQRKLDWPYDYISIPKLQYEENRTKLYDQLEGNLKVVHDNGRLLLLKYFP